MLAPHEKPSGLFDAQELDQLEGAYPGGVSSQQIISLFQERGVKLSEATFRNMFN